MQLRVAPQLGHHCDDRLNISEPTMNPTTNAATATSIRLAMTPAVRSAGGPSHLTA
jgi:hypothetical protein